MQPEKKGRIAFDRKYNVPITAKYTWISSIPKWAAIYVYIAAGKTRQKEEAIKPREVQQTNVQLFLKDYLSKNWGFIPFLY